jgi:hypothetical protein
MNGFLPPVIFEIKAKATEAIAEFKKVNAELTKMEKNADKTALGMMRMEKAAKLTKIALIGVATAFGVLAVAGVKAAMDQEKAMALLQTAVKNTGQNFQAASPFINEVSNSLIKLGFHDEETVSVLAKLTAATGDVKVAMNSMNVVADLARFKQMSLADAGDLVARASTGQAKGLRDLGIALGKNIDKNASLADVLKAVQDRTKGAADAFSKTSEGKLQVFNAQLDTLKENIGKGLLPALNKFVDFMNKTGLPALEKFFKFIDDNKKTIINFGLVLGGLWATTKIVKGIEATILLYLKLRKAIEFVQKAVIALRVALLGTNPVGWAIAAVVGVTAGLTAIHNKFFAKNKTSAAPGWGNVYGEATNTIGDGASWAGGKLKELSDALINAKQKVIDFNDKVKSTFADMKGVWAGIAGKDFNAAIQEGLLNPVDKLVTKAQTAVNTYQTASNQYQGALSKLKSAQDAYTKAVAGGNKTLIASTESALKKAEDLVTGLQKGMGDALSSIAQLQQDMIDAVVEAQNKINDLQSERKTVLADGLKEELALQKDYNAKVLSLQQDAAKRSADIVKTSVDQMRGIFKGATSRGIGDIFSGLTFEGKYLKGGSLEAITGALATQTQKATSLADKAGKLQALGFTQTFIEEIIAQGPDVGGALADTILAGSPEAVAQLNAYWLALEKVSSHGVDSIAKKLNSGITLATEELTAQLASVQTDLTTALADAYSDYSDSLAKIREKTAEQIKIIDDQISELIAKIAQLQAALAALALLSAPGVVAPTPKLSGSGMGTYDAAGRYIGTPFGQAGGNTTNITVNQQNLTNADANKIAADTAWAIRSSGDLNFTATRSMERTGTTTPIVTKGSSPLSGTSVRGN